MLQEKNFQVGFLIIQILTAVLVGAFIIPFAGNWFEDYSKLPQFPIWGVEIFFAILTIIIIVVSIKLLTIKENKLRYLHVFVSFLNAGVFFAQIVFCIQRMSGR